MTDAKWLGQARSRWRSRQLETLRAGLARGVAPGCEDRAQSSPIEAILAPRRTLDEFREVFDERDPHQAGVVLVEQDRVSAVSHRGDIVDPGCRRAHGQVPATGAPALAALIAVGRLLEPIGVRVRVDEPLCDLVTIAGGDQQINAAVPRAWRRASKCRLLSSG